MKSNTILIIGAALVLALGAYWYFFTGTGNQTPLSASASTNQAQAQFQTLVGELQNITFNTNIFSDPRFIALVDITTPISPESSGRIDPLAPISSASSASVATPVVTKVAATSTPASSGTK